MNRELNFRAWDIKSKAFIEESIEGNIGINLV